MRNTSALRFTNGSAQAVTAAAASSINNLGSFTVAMWVDLTTVAPAAQRNFFGKSTGNSRVVGFINATTISVQCGSSVSAPTATATTTNCPGVAANQPVFIAFVVDAGVDVPKLYTGSLCIPASEPSAYSAQTTGSTTGHDDSASAWNFANGGSVGTTNTIPGNVLSVQVLNRIPRDLAEVREMQYDPWNPTRSGCVLSWRVGASGELVVLDESGRGNHGAVAGAPPLVVDPLPFVKREQPSMGRWKRALFAPSGTGSLTATLGAATLSATGALQIAGSATVTLDAATVSATGSLPIIGALTSTLAAATVAGAGSLPITGAATVTLDAATLSATGTIGSFATLAVTLDAATLTATGTLPVVGAATVTLSAATLSGTGALPIVATLTATLATVTLSATGTGSDTGTSAAYMAASLFHVADTDEIYYTADTDPIYFTATEG